MPPDFLPTHHRSLRLQNFTAFGDATFEFVPGVNVLVGENGTGKTHALKLLLHFSKWLHFQESVLLGLVGLFSLASIQETEKLRRLGSPSGTISWNRSYGGVALKLY